VHMIVRAALGLAAERQLVVRNVASSAQLKLPRAGGPIARSWTAAELATFLDNSRHHRLHTALHLAACTGMRRGEIPHTRSSWTDRGPAPRAARRQRLPARAERPCNLLRGSHPW
jgi:integrase